MRWNHYFSYFFGGAFLANAIPHFVNGVMGHPFQSPFASPPGQGLSSAMVNVLGRLQPRYGLFARVPSRNLRATPDEACHCCWIRCLADGLDIVPSIWAILWRHLRESLC